MKHYIPEIDKDFEPVTNILDIEAVSKIFTFTYESHDSIHYLCPCGNNIQKKISQEDKDQIIDFAALTGSIPGEDDDEDVHQVFNLVKSSAVGSLKCDKCDKKIVHTSNLIIPMDTTFVSGFKHVNTENELILYFSKAKAQKWITTVGKVRDFNYGKISLSESIKFLKFTKLAKKLTVGNGEEETEFDLDEINKIVNNFFKAETPTIMGIMDIHLFLGDLAKYVSDSKNIDIINELISRIRGRNNYAGLEEIKRIVSIFFAIIKYSNLSTIALTKGPNFLYDLIVQCDIPKPNVLRENNVTSPIKIFNFLITNYINKINEEVNGDNKLVHDFIYKSKGKHFNLKIKKQNDYKEGKVVKSEKGKYEVLDVSKDQTISKFIYKTIRNFSDYRQLMKYLKFFDKNELITIIQKYDLDFLLIAIDMIYFRDRIDMREFARLSNLFISFAKESQVSASPKLLFNEETDEYEMTEEMDEIDFSEIEPDYGVLKKGFDFSYYDGCITMLDFLKTDTKNEEFKKILDKKFKEFVKIKAFSKLKKFHDELVKHFRIATDSEKINKFTNFVERFKFLESREDYDGPLEVILISSPEMLMQEGVEMKHSAGSYSRRVINEEYVIGRVYDRSEDIEEGELVRFTIGFNFNNLNGLEFHQVKGFGNDPGSDRFKILLMEYLTEKDISYRQIVDLKLSGQ